MDIYNNCTSIIQKVYVYTGVIKSDGYNIITNSCTGVVEKINFNEISSIGLLIFAVALGWALGKM